MIFQSLVLEPLSSSISLSLKHLSQTGVPQFLDTMRMAVFGYKDFLEERRKALGVDQLDNRDKIRQIYGLPPDTQGPPWSSTVLSFSLLGFIVLYICIPGNIQLTMIKISVVSYRTKAWIM